MAHQRDQAERQPAQVRKEAAVLLEVELAAASGR